MNILPISPIAEPTRLTIITINLNNAVGLMKTLNSISEQTDKNFEHIIIDGGSEDASIKRIEEYVHNNKATLKRIYWLSEDDKGIFDAMNKGIKAAKGQYLLFLNSGDYLTNKFVLSSIAPILNKGTDLIYGDLIIETKSSQTPISFPDSLSLSYLIKYSLPHQATFIRKDLFDQIGLYDDSFSLVSDWVWFIKCFANKKTEYIHTKSFITVFNGDGLSSTTEKKAIFEERTHALRKTFSAEFTDFVIDYLELEQKYWTLNKNILVRLLSRIMKRKYHFTRKRTLQIS